MPGRAGQRRPRTPPAAPLSKGVDKGGPKIRFTARATAIEPGRRLVLAYVHGAFRGSAEFTVDLLEDGGTGWPCASVPGRTADSRCSPGWWTSARSTAAPPARPSNACRAACWPQRSRRLGGEASFAALCGVSPVERSSGRHHYRRLNRGGDRQANAALQRIVQARLRFDPRTRDYYERRTKEGKTRREIVRGLKRYVAREFSNLVRPSPS
ncbi:transposase [Streptomyces sp. NPDC015125]|uniref:transposase n=1 Tax=Streptomyces sp. NPDC015125 TaxID=3364938 RepID=UPI0036F51109